MNFKHEIGKNLKKARLERDLTQANVAELANLEPHSISSIESGRSLSFESWEKLCLGLDIHPRDFLNFERGDNNLYQGLLLNAKDTLNNLSYDKLRMAYIMLKSIEEAPPFKFYKTKK